MTSPLAISARAHCGALAPRAAPRRARAVGRARAARSCRPRASSNDAGAATEEPQPAPSGGAPAPPASPSRMSRTMADLDAMLGIEEAAQGEPAKASATAEDSPLVSVSPDVLRTLAEAEAARAENAGVTAASPDAGRRVKDSVARIVEQARKLSEAEGKGGAPPDAASSGEKAMRAEFETLLTAISGARAMPPDDVRRLKDEAFRGTGFWVTGSAPAAGVEGGLLVRGNLRGESGAAFAAVAARVREMYGDRFIVRMIPDPEADPLGGGGDDAASGGGAPGPRPVFEILPAAAALPPESPGWQRGAAALLLLLTLGSATQLGLAASVGLLPRETLAWLANPANLSADALPPGLEDFDPTAFLRAAASVGGAALLPQAAHEAAQAAAAAAAGVKTGPAFFVPNAQLGTFGAVTQLKSFVASRAALLDFAGAGLAGGLAASAALFAAGLAASAGAGGGADAADAAARAAASGLVPVPSSLLQGSLLLGALCRGALGADAVAHPSVLVSPLLVGGWCGLVATSLNALPVGNLDGGRAWLAAFGRQGLALSSLATYAGLGLGLLGSSLALPFGLYVLICQREAERYVQDEVTPPDGRRRAAALALVALAVAVLLPGFGEGGAADVAALGQPAAFL